MWPWLPMHPRARHEVVIGREIKKRENLVFTKSSTIREILYLRKIPTIQYDNIPRFALQKWKACVRGYNTYREGERLYCK